ncbi:MAG: outer membrane beta-barrel protein [Lysobacter sp.]
MGTALPTRQSRPRTASSATLRPSLLASAILLVIPVGAGAADLEYELGMSVLHSDNIALSSFDETSDTVVSPSLRFTLDQQSSWLRTKASGSVAYLDYLSNTFDSEVRGDLAGEMLWSVLPRRIDFVVNDYLNRQPVNVLTGFNPTNQQQVNVFIAGPTFHARFSDGFRGQLDLRYANTYAETTDDFNGNHYNAAARLLRDTSANQSVSVNLESSQSEYDDPADNYRRDDAYIGYSLRLAALELTAAGGYSRVRLEDGSGDHGQPLARAAVTWSPTARSRLVAVARQGFSNAAQDLVNRTTDLEGSIINELSSNDVLVSAEAVKQQELYLAYHFDSERWAFHAQPYYQRSRSIGTAVTGPVDPANPDPASLATRDSYGGLFAVDYRLSSRSTVSLLLAHDENRYDDIDRKDRGYIAALSLAHRLSRHWSWRADLQHRQRDSSVAAASYDENAAVFSVAYLR